LRRLHADLDLKLEPWKWLKAVMAGTVNVAHGNPKELSIADFYGRRLDTQVLYTLAVEVCRSKRRRVRWQKSYPHGLGVGLGEAGVHRGVGGFDEEE
jgi:hypothetical protein